MPTIPASINGVNIEFTPQVNNSVDQKVISALRLILDPNIAPPHQLNKIYISSANDQHQFPSRHVQGSGKAVDISWINGLKMSVHYSTDSLVKDITDALQTEFENYPQKRENFGPLFKKKLGKAHTVSGHKDHIHLSVN